MTNETIKIEWTTTTGIDVHVEVTLRKTVECLADHTTIKAICEIVTTGYIGDKCTGTWMVPVTGHPIAVARIDALGIPQAQYSEIQDAIATLEQSEYFRAWQAREEHARAAEKKYWREDAQIRKMMSM